MVERYHLVLAVIALFVGSVLLVVDLSAARWLSAPQRPSVTLRLGAARRPRAARWPSAARWPTAVRWLSSRLIALAGVVGALLGGLGSPRAWPWLVVAVLVVAWPDEPASAHPLGRYTAALTVVSLAGVWSAVPDTEPALAVGLVLAPMALVRAVRGPSAGPAATAALVVAVSGAVWVGSAGWGAALATFVAVGVVAVGPLVLGFGRALAGTSLAVLAGAHTLAALVVPRVVMRQSVPVAVGIGLGVLVLLTGLCAVVGHRDPAADRPAHRSGVRPRRRSG